VAAKGTTALLPAEHSAAAIVTPVLEPRSAATNVNAAAATAVDGMPQRKIRRDSGTTMEWILFSILVGEIISWCQQSFSRRVQQWGL